VNIGDKYVDKCAQLIPERSPSAWLRGAGFCDQRSSGKRRTAGRKASSVALASIGSLSTSSQVTAALLHSTIRALQQATLTRVERFIKNKEGFDPIRHKHDPSELRQASMALLARIAKSIRLPGGRRKRCTLAAARERDRTLSIRRPNNAIRVASRNRRLRKEHILRCGLRHWFRRMICAGMPARRCRTDPFVGTAPRWSLRKHEHCTGIGIDLNGQVPGHLAVRRVLETRVNGQTPEHHPGDCATAGWFCMIGQLRFSPPAQSGWGWEQSPTTQDAIPCPSESPPDFTTHFADLTDPRRRKVIIH